MLNVAMLSKWHVHAAGYARELMAMDDVNVTCIWDEDAERGAAWAKELGVAFEADLDELLRRPDVDAVAVNCPTAMHPEVIIKAARAGKHIFTEKVLALTVRECDEIAKAINEAGVKFCISFPQRCWGRNKYIKHMVESGALGQVTVMRARDAHDGSLRNWLPDYWYDRDMTGGGAMMDLGAHPMYLASWMMGRPRRIQSMFNNITGRAVEDNSVCTIEFENGAIVISETSLVAPMNPKLVEVYGTKGVIICQDNDIKVRLAGQEGFSVPELPENDPAPIRQWVEGVLYGKEIPFDLKAARDLTELMENAYIADGTGHEVFFKK